jgi:chromosome partitioning protein
LAVQQQEVFLWDLDRQRSALTWLSMRPAHAPRIVRLDNRDHDAHPDDPAEGWLIIDSPAGLHGKSLSQATKHVHKVLVPVQPSVFDMAATAVFLQDLAEEKSVRKSRTFVGVVGVRVDPRTRAAATLEAFLEQFELPILTYLRDTQVYANAAFNGLTIFDLPPYMAERDREQWAPVLQWLSNADPRE